ncbi:hypothetical protein AgCh_034479 [Apium graveolens]
MPIPQRETEDKVAWTGASNGVYSAKSGYRLLESYGSECFRVFGIGERFNKLINDLQLHDKYYEAEEVNLKFLLTLPDHLEQKISAIRGHVVDGSSALIVNESQTSNDEPRSQTPVASTSEQRTNVSHEQVILELEKDEFYTLEELDELDQSMAYLARKFSNISVKNPRYFKNKGQSFNKDNSWKEKGKYNSDSKNGYKTGYVDRSNVRCFNCDEQGHFATECKKPKKAKKDKAYLELEAKYEALLRKRKNKAYIAEGKSWDDSGNDKDEEFGNFALMGLKQGESSSSKLQTPTLTTIDLNMNQYKETVEKMSTEMFHIHTSMVSANKEVSRLTKINEKLESEKQETELLLVELEALKQ